MNLRELGKTGMKFTSVGLGTWMMEDNPKDSVSALRAGIEAGANHIDTAEMYGEGKVEDVVGQAIKGLRDRIFLVSKVLPSHATYEGTIQACERSLKHLQTDYLDVYLLHWREEDTNLAEAFRAFEKLKEDGKVRAWGVSNFDVDDMEDAVKIAGEGKIACNQVLYHIKERAIEAKLLPWCQSHDVSLVAYSPFGQGRLPNNPVLEKIAKAHKATPDQIVLSALTNKPKTFAIPKSSNKNRTLKNIQAMDIVLSPGEIQQLDQAFPPKARHGLPMI